MTVRNRPASPNHRFGITFGVIAAAYLAIGVFDHEIWSPTEPAVSGVVWNMVERDLVVAPHIGDYPYLEKPPLYYWMAWVSCELGGLDPGWLRFPALLAGLGTLGVIGWVTRRRYGDDVAALSLVAAASTLEIWSLSHRASADILAIFFAFLCFGLFSNTLSDEEAEDMGTHWRADLLFALALGLSFHAKNFFTYLIVLPPVVAYLAIRRDWRRIVRIGAFTGAATLLWVLPWALALERDGGPEFVKAVFVDNTLGRFFDLPAVERAAIGPLNDARSAERDGSAFVYAGYAFVVPLPWTPAVAAALFALFGKRRAGDFRLFLKTLLVAIPVALSLSSSRNGDYLNPILFGTLLALADLTADVVSGAPVRAWARKTLEWNWTLAIAVMVLAPAAAAIGARSLPMALVALASAAVLTPAVWRRRSEGLVSRERWRLLATAAIPLLIAGGFMVRWLDGEKSLAPFFAEVKRERGGRELYTTYRDDRRYPAITWYLRQAVPWLDPKDPSTFDILGSGRPVALITHKDFYADSRGRFDAFPHEIHRAAVGGGKFVLVTAGAEPVDGS